MRRLSLAVSAIVVASSLAGGAYANSAQEKANAKVAIALYNAALNEKDWNKALKYIGPRYVQHNPNAASGPEGFKAHIDNLKKNFPLNHGEIKKVFATDDLVAIHVHVKRKPEDRGYAVVDMFRVEKGKVVEHWDVVQTIPEKALNDNTMF
ncbi:MAG: nuclear transport factor 2 family protein [Caulobacteraceae bacterium]